jgi:hypothetical protein
MHGMYESQNRFLCLTILSILFILSIILFASGKYAGLSGAK